MPQDINSLNKPMSLAIDGSSTGHSILYTLGSGAKPHYRGGGATARNEKVSSAKLHSTWQAVGPGNLHHRAPQYSFPDDKSERSSAASQKLENQSSTSLYMYVMNLQIRP